MSKIEKKVEHFWKGFIKSTISIGGLAVGATVYLLDKETGKDILKKSVILGAEASDDYFMSTPFYKEEDYDET